MTLDRLIRLSGYSKESFAKEMGLTRTGLYYKLKRFVQGKNSFYSEELDRMANLLGVTFSDLLIILRKQKTTKTKDDE